MQTTSAQGFGEGTPRQDGRTSCVRAKRFVDAARRRAAAWMRSRPVTSMASQRGCGWAPSGSVESEVPPTYPTSSESTLGRLEFDANHGRTHHASRPGARPAAMHRRAHGRPLPPRRPRRRTACVAALRIRSRRPWQNRRNAGIQRWHDQQVSEFTGTGNRARADACAADAACSVTRPIASFARCSSARSCAISCTSGASADSRSLTPPPAARQPGPLVPAARPRQSRAQASSGSSQAAADPSGAASDRFQSRGLPPAREHKRDTRTQRCVGAHALCRRLTRGALAHRGQWRPSGS
jgi:hypothetical protein